MDTIRKGSLSKLREKLLEALQAVLPIVAIVLVLCFSIAPVSPSILLCFLLGAIYFKKSKIAKTFLAIIITGMLFSIISAPFTSVMPGLIERIQEGDPERVLRRIWTAIWILDGLEIVIFLAIYYFRLRTIKH